MDVGCGSGQATKVLAPHFDQVLGTDISSTQISQAQAANRVDNISYRVARAEDTSLPSGSYQLVIGVSACHWFDLPAFYAEVGRLLTPGGALAMIGHRPALPIFRGEERHDLQFLATALTTIDFGKPKEVIAESDRLYLEGYSGPRFVSSLTDHKEFRDVFCDMHVTVADLIGFCSTWHSVPLLAAARGEKACANFLEGLQIRVLDMLGHGANVDSPIVLRFGYYALMSRQPKNF